MHFGPRGVPFVPPSDGWGIGPGAYDSPAGDRGPRFSLGSRPSGAMPMGESPGALRPRPPLLSSLPCAFF